MVNETVKWIVLILQNNNNNNNNNRSKSVCVRDSIKNSLPDDQ
jgi:hypothetical protein